MVVTWDRSLKVRRKFTNDGREISDVLKQQEDLSTLGQTRITERADIIRRIDETKSETEAFAEARQYALAYKNDIDFTVDALKKTVDQLAGVEGRKILLHVSEGLPQSPGAELWKYVQDKFRTQTGGLSQFEFDKTAAYLGIIRAANAAGVSMYMVDASGLTIDSGISAENRTTEAKIDSFVERTNLQSMIQLMAEETGGKAFLNRNDVTGPLNDMRGDYTSYYSVGYRSLKSGGERPRKVTVKMKKKGLKARSRRSYVEKGLETRITEGVTSALYFARDDNPLAVGVEVGQRRPRRRAELSRPDPDPRAVQPDHAPPGGPDRTRARHPLLHRRRLRRQAVRAREPGRPGRGRRQGAREPLPAGLRLRRASPDDPGRAAAFAGGPRRADEHRQLRPAVDLRLGPPAGGAPGGEVNPAVVLIGREPEADR